MKYLIAIVLIISIAVIYAVGQKTDPPYDGHMLFIEEGFAKLIDNEKNLINKWALPLGTNRAKLLENGDLMFNRPDHHGWVQINWNDSIDRVFTITGDIGAHDDFAEDKDGKFYFIVRNLIENKSVYQHGPFWSDSIILRDEDGTISWRWDVIDYIHELVDELPIKAMAITDGHPDLAHMNSIQNLGPVLTVTMKNLNRVLLIDVETKDIWFNWGKDSLDMPTSAAWLTDTQDVLLLNNNGPSVNMSTVLKYNNYLKTFTWVWGEEAGQDFYTETDGSVQELPNGNVLLAIADEKRIIEISRAGDIVWEQITRNRVLQAYKYPKDLN